jgi:hypothetical protein
MSSSILWGSFVIFQTNDRKLFVGPCSWPNLLSCLPSVLRDVSTQENCVALTMTLNWTYLFVLFLLLEYRFLISCGLNCMYLITKKPPLWSNKSWINQSINLQIQVKNVIQCQNMYSTRLGANLLKWLENHHHYYSIYKHRYQHNSNP